MTTKLESNCIERGWTLVEFDDVWIDVIFDRLMDSVNDKYYIVPSFIRGYDDPRTSKVYFRSKNDAWSFKVLIKDLLKDAVN